MLNSAQFCSILLRYAQMTPHVVTRPYRAPEAILCAGNYSQVQPGPPVTPADSVCYNPSFLLGRSLIRSKAIDVWSVGCILAELFEFFKRQQRSRLPLFKLSSRYSDCASCIFLLLNSIELAAFDSVSCLFCFC
jgi:serine/threonine protein kinase